MELEKAKSNFLNYCEFEKGLSSNTRKSYHYELKDYLSFMQEKQKREDTKEIVKEDIEAYLKYCYQRNEDSKTVAHKLTTLNNFHQYLEKEEIKNNSFNIYLTYTLREFFLKYINYWGNNNGRK